MENLIPLDLSPLGHHVRNIYFRDNNNTLYIRKYSKVYQLKPRAIYSKNPTYVFAIDTVKEPHPTGRKYSTLFVVESKLYDKGILKRPEHVEVQLKDTLVGLDEVWESRIGISRTKGQWFYEDVCEFYRVCELEIPVTWWEKWVRVLDMERIT